MKDGKKAEVNEVYKEPIHFLDDFFGRQWNPFPRGFEEPRRRGEIKTMQI